MSWSQPNPPLPPPPTLFLVDKPHRGRSIIAARTIRPGEVVLIDFPLLVYPSTLSAITIFCSCCFRVLPAGALHCPSCHVALFCSYQCLSRSHPPLLCLGLPSLHSGATNWPDDALFLLSAYSLPPELLEHLLTLHSNSNFPEESTQPIHAQLAAIIPPDRVPAHFSHETTASLLSKEKTNSFPLMNPKDPRYDEYGVAGARANGLYPRASLFNHDCVPNTCRFHYIDTRLHVHNTNVIFRAFREIKEGTELCISYVGVTWGYKERQRKLLYDYEFRCDCDRCIIESAWPENLGDIEEDDEVALQMVEDDKEAVEEVGEEAGEEGQEVVVGENVVEGEEDDVVQKVEEEEEAVGKNVVEGEEVIEVVQEENEATEEEETEIGEEEGNIGEGGNGEEGEDEYLISQFLLKHVCVCGGCLAPLPPTSDGALSQYMECNSCNALKPI